MMVALSTGCGAGVAVLIAFVVLLFVVTAWPSYFLGLLSLPDATVARVRHAVVLSSIALLVAATGAVVFLVVGEC